MSRLDPIISFTKQKLHPTPKQLTFTVFLAKLFCRKHASSCPSIPPMDEIVAYMQDIELSFFSDSIVRILSSSDRTKRIVILQSDHGYYKTVYEELQLWDEDEWNYFANDPNKYPAYWNPVDSPINSNSFYGTEDEAFAAITSSKEFQTYFL